MLILAEACSILILLALYAALRRASPSLMTIALTLGLLGIALFFAVNPTFSMLYLSDQYQAATTEVQRATFLAAGEALWANYNGTAFGLFFVLCGVSYLLISDHDNGAPTEGTWHEGGRVMSQATSARRVAAFMPM
jgi:hypothetical protein